ncbi:hypothetical protein AB0K00_27035 [Dactylosporangium sp. NPDC049525]|uniref:hypothetical protein n=1 Tax=Dactylosporangium sp. NPDC049525 TaxID=3154730 RepID=UPI00342090C4
MSNLTRILIYLLAVVIVAALALKIRRMSKVQGYRFGRDVIVRCRDGHLFMTTWIPAVSFKAIRLGLLRFQYCPVGGHFTAVRLMRDEDLTLAERREAGRHHDNGVP